MRSTAILCLAFFTSSVFAEQAKIEWQKTVSEPGRFEVQFPGKPADNSNKTQIQYVLEAEGGKVAHLASANPFQKSIDLADKDQMKKILDNGKDGLLKGFKNSKILSERNSTFAGKYPCRDVDLEIPGLGLYRTKWIVTPDAFIQLVVLGPTGYVEGATSSLFFDSVKVLEGGKK